MTEEPLSLAVTASEHQPSDQPIKPPQAAPPNTTSTFKRRLFNDINQYGDRLAAVWSQLKHRIQCRIYGDRESLPARTIYINIRPPKEQFNRKGVYLVTYPTNEIHTTKYNLLTFLPKNLFEQFRRLANFYFLALVVLQCLPMFQVSSPFFAALPITFIVFVTAMKDGFEDWKRHLSDNEINGSTTQTLASYVNCNYLGVRMSGLKKVKKLMSSYYRSMTGRRRPYAIGAGQVELMNLDTDDDELNGGETSAASASESEMPAIDGRGGGDRALITVGGACVEAIETTASSSAEEDAASGEEDLANELPERQDSLGPLPASEPKIASSPLTTAPEAAAVGLSTKKRRSFRKSISKRISRRLTGDGQSSLSNKKKRKRKRKKAKKPKPSGWTPRHWEDLQVGELVFLRNNDSVPADIIVLNTSEPDGLCYIETKNLDGETNLKIRNGFPQFSYLDSKQKIQDLHMRIEVEPPNTHLYSFKAAISVAAAQQPQQQSAAGVEYFPTASVSDGSIASPAASKKHSASAIGGLSEKKIPVTINELLLRGCTLRNTDWVIGVVVYTGEDTRLLMNSGETPSKRSMIEISMNIQVFLMLLFLLLLCTAVSIGSYIIAKQATSGQSQAPYLFPSSLAESISQSTFYVFIASLIMLQNIVPISLYVTAEFVKLIQAFLIYSDIEMYYEPVDKPCIPKTWTIADDLGMTFPTIILSTYSTGQIEYLFSDKTGTLTKNVMEFRKCSIGGVIYGKMLDEMEESPEIESARMLRQLNANYNNPYAEPTITFFDNDRFAQHLADTSKPQSSIIKEFFTHLSICHTVLAEYPDEDDQFSVLYKAQSPDEAALVRTAKNVGFAFLDRVQDEVSVNILGQDIDFKLLHLIEFNSDRKRMSVIVRTPDDTIILYIKGADSKIFERLADGQQEMKDRTFQHLESFASDGLRTLCLAYRVISPAEYVEWSAEYARASALIVDREKAMDEVAERIERDLLLLGATAIEDQLQDGVPDCIARLSKAGIKIWVLTGDKMETAINIGFSCCLLTREMVLVVIKGHDEQSVGEQIKEALDRCFSLDAAVVAGERQDEEITEFRERLPEQHMTNPAAIDSPAASNGISNAKVDGEEDDDDNDDDEEEENQKLQRPFALIIDGESLKYSLEGRNKSALLELACRCHSVICCRVSPLQKAQVVQLVKEGKRAMTMAIGDGANDVSMIQQANVGVGISGQEGVQAVMASDYAIAQFRFLTRLLLVHGRWSYLRFAKMVLLMFHKNFIWTLVLFWYQFFSGFTASILYNYFFILLYNIVFTGLPPIIIGAFDQDIQAKQAVQVPAMYRGGIKHQNYGIRKFLSYVFDGVYQSLVCFFLGYWLVAESGPINTNGYSVDFIVLGTVSATLAIINANLYMGFCTNYWTWVNHFAIWGSILVFMGVVLVGTALSSSSLYGILPFTYGCLSFWLCVPVSVVLCFLPKYLYVIVRIWTWPNDVDILREITLFKLDSWRFVREEDLHSSMGSGLVDGVPELPDRRSSLPSITEGQQQQQQQQQQQPASSAAAFAQKLNQELDKRIGEPLKRHLTQIPARFRRAASMLVMKNGRMERNTGFAFSQQPGIVSHLSKLGVGSPITLRRRASKFNSDSALEKQPAGRLGSSQSIAASDRGEAANSAAARNNSISPPYWVQHLQRALNPRSRRGSNVSGTSSKRSHGPSSAPASPALSPTTFPAVAVPTDGQSAVQSLSQTEVMLPGAAVVTNVSEGECEENNLSTKIDD